MKDLVEFLVKSIVAHPEQVKVEEVASDEVITLIISANSDDIKLVIGRHGTTIRAIRTLVRVKAIKEKKRIFLEIKEGKD